MRLLTVDGHPLCRYRAMVHLAPWRFLFVDASALSGDLSEGEDRSRSVCTGEYHVTLKPALRLRSSKNARHSAQRGGSYLTLLPPLLF